jgi:NADH-quinone oxidoreductase subunit N
LGGYFYTSPGVVGSKLFVILTSLFVLNSAESYIREHSRHVIEFSVVLLLGVLLLLLLVSSNNLMVLFLALAGFSLTLYTLIIYDVADAACREASVKYFYLSAISAGLIAFGIFLFYSQVQSVGYADIRLFVYDDFHDTCDVTILNTATLFILLGLLFKLSAFPGHL